MQLSEHFTLDELCYSDTAIRNGINNLAPDDVHDNLRRLCVLLEQVRKIVARPTRINYRLS